jgi:hypothetical protein
MISKTKDEDGMRFELKQVLMLIRQQLMVVTELKRVSRFRKEFQDLMTTKFDASVKGE